MSNKAFDKIAEGLNEALAIAHGDAQPARMHVPAELDVRAIRTKIGMSQDVFASSFGFTLSQVRQWEQGRHRPLQGLRAYLIAIERDHRTILSLLAQYESTRAAA
jgi:putative transcriptional regulator